MKTELLKGKNQQQKEQFRADWVASRPVREHLGDILESRIKETSRKRLSRAKYFMPSWKEYQADCIGYIRALEELKQLLSDQEDQHE